MRRSTLAAVLAPLALLADPQVVSAAEAASGPAAFTAALLGVASGAALLALVAYALASLIRPLWPEHRDTLARAFLALAALWLLKTVLLLFFPGYGPDVGSYQSWALEMASRGPAGVYREGYFLDYPPGYLYALWAAGSLAQLIGAGGTTLRMIVESPALIADLLLAVAVFASVLRADHPRLAWTAMALIALNPALLFDTVVWGQSDSVLALVMLLALVAFVDRRFALGWMLAALAVLIKPQGLMLVPVFGFWTLLESPPRAYLPSIAGAFGTFAVGVAPFQLGRPWDWIFSLYGATAAHYAETSVNAFNLLALLGGLRQPDSATVLGVSYFTVGMLLLVPLYAYAGYLLWRRRDAHTLYFAAFIAIFGFFILAPRMHERYLYAALVFGAPLAAQCATMLALYAALTVACLVNLASVLDVLNTGGFFAPRDPLAMAASAVNVSLFAAALWYGWTRLDKAPARAAPDVLRFLSDRLFAAPPPAAADTAESPSPAWLRADTMVIIALTAAAIATRFWNLSHPGEIVFDEVHFVGQARHYLRAEPFLDPHPPLAKLVIAAGIWLFGDGPWGWRVGIAAVGTALVPITYLLARRMMRSRTAGALAAAFVLADGMFLVDSRIAVIDIVYVTLAALSYLIFFRFVDSRDDQSRRRALLGLGAALGLCVAAKLYVPAFTFLLVMGFLGYVLTRDHRRPTRCDVAAFALTGSVAALAYLAVFLPHYAHGWWGGIEDLFNYYRDVIWYQESVAAATHPYASPWWSWPLMLRPIAYWQEFPKEGAVAIVWAGGNPVLWWGALTVITITTVQALERPTLARSFLVIAYLGYLAIWIWVGRTLFLYHYLPAVYLGYVALAAVLTQAWQGRAEPWEHLALLLTLAPALVLSLGVVAGFGIFLLILIAYAWQLATSPRAGRLVTALFVAAAAIAFVYFLPIWLGLPIDRASFYERMWLKGPGIRNWI